MASQIYARYIPPKKGTAKLADSTVSPLWPSPAPTSKLHASSTYTRSPKRNWPESERASISKKRKTGGGGVDLELGEHAEGPAEPSVKKSKKGNKAPKATADAHGVSELGESLGHNPSTGNDAEFGFQSGREEDGIISPSQPKKSKKKSKKKSSRADASLANDVEQTSMHAKVLDKRQNSLRKAERRAATEAAEEQEEEKEVVEHPEELPEELLYDLAPLPQPDAFPEPNFTPAPSLPPWLARPIRISPKDTATFEEVGLPSDIGKALLAKGFKNAFAIQAAVLPKVLPGKFQQPGDILVSAATGSGKTLAYVLPIIEDLSRQSSSRLQGLIIMPTRELVSQAREVGEACAVAFSGEGRSRVKIGTAVGSDKFKEEQASLITLADKLDPEGRREQKDAINRRWSSHPDINDGFLFTEEILSEVAGCVPIHESKVDILICTPGRLVEHINSTPGFTLEHVRWLVVDEADKLLGQAFQNWLGLVIAKLPSKTSLVRKMVLSATITRDIGELSRLRLHHPKLIALEGGNTQDDLEEGDNILPSLLAEVAVKVEEDSEKPLYLMEILRGSTFQSLTIGTAPVDSPHGVLIFTNSNESTTRLARLIALLSPPLANRIATLTSHTPSSNRNRNIKSFTAGNLSVLVASDLVSRGLDLPNLGHVINYDIPTSVTGYVHRVGRTARAGKVGEAITLYTGREGRWFWNEIGRGSIGRGEGKKVERRKVTVEDGTRKGYGAALKMLATETKHKSKRS